MKYKGVFPKVFNLSTFKHDKNLSSEEREHKRTAFYAQSVTLLHIVLSFVYWYKDTPSLLILNLLALPICALTIYSVTKQAYRTSIIILAVILLVHVVLATLVFGTHSGIHMGLWPLACVFAINVRIRVAYAIVFASLCLFAFLYLELFGPDQTNIEFFAYSLEILLLLFGGFLVSAVMSIRSAFQIQRVKLERLASRDALTGLYNRRYFSTFLNYQKEVVQREKNTFCLALTDIDHFKVINDTYGHDVGDEVLKNVSACFSSILAKSDAICRWGGEEFIIFVPNSNVDDTLPVFEAIREVISETKTNNISVTMSFGLVESNGTESIETVIKRADALLYQAKSKGRNNVQHRLVELNR